MLTKCHRTGNRKLKTVVAFALLVCVFMCASAAAAERKCNIAIVKSWDLPDYNAALEGFFEVMEIFSPSIRLSRVDLPALGVPAIVI